MKGLMYWFVVGSLLCGVAVGMPTAVTFASCTGTPDEVSRMVFDPGEDALTALTDFQAAGGTVTSLTYAWRDHSTWYPLEDDETIAEAVTALKAHRQRYVASEIPSLTELVAGYVPVNAEEELFRVALAERRDRFVAEQADLERGIVALTAAEVVSPSSAVFSALSTGHCLPLSATPVEPLASVEPTTELPSPYTWLPSLGVNEVDLRGGRGSDQNYLKSYFWWNDISGFTNTIHHAYEHEIVVAPYDLMECAATFAVTPSDYEGAFDNISKWEFVTSSKDHIAEKLLARSVLLEECKEKIDQNIKIVHFEGFYDEEENEDEDRFGLYVDTRFLDNWHFHKDAIVTGTDPLIEVDWDGFTLKTAAGTGEDRLYKAFTFGIENADQLQPHHLYSVTFQLKVPEDAPEVGELIFSPQLSHRVGADPGSEFNSGPAAEWFGYDESWFTERFRAALCDPNETCPEEGPPGAYIYSSRQYQADPTRTITVGENTLIKWRSGIGWFDNGYGRPDHRGASTEGVRHVYDAYSYIQEDAVGRKRHCNTVGIPFDHNGGGYFVHEWRGAFLQNFQQQNRDCHNYGAESAIILPYEHAVEAFLVSGKIWDFYQERGGGIVPIASSVELADGEICQDFATIDQQQSGFVLYDAVNETFIFEMKAPGRSCQHLRNRTFLSMLETHWAKMYWDFLQEQQAINVVDFLTLEYAAPATRAEVLETAYLGSGQEGGVFLESGFRDVPLDHKYFQYIADAKHKGYVVGVTACPADEAGVVSCQALADQKCFCPEAPVTRAEASKVILEVFGVTPYVSDDIGMTFSDVLEADWFYEYVTWMAHTAVGDSQEHIIQGYHDGHFLPHGLVLRSEMTKLVANFMKYHMENDSDVHQNSLMVAENVPSTIGYLYEQRDDIANQTAPLPITLAQGESEVTLPSTDTLDLSLATHDADGDQLFYFWYATGGEFVAHDTQWFSDVSWVPPQEAQGDCSVGESETECRYILSGVRGDGRGLVGRGRLTVYVTYSLDTSLCQAVTEISQLECVALLHLYHATAGSEWKQSDGWLQTDTPCSWYGITCQSDHVSQIRLSRNNLVGTLPSQVGDFRWLDTLYLYGNTLQGGIPVALQNLVELRYLSLGNNTLTGMIPVELTTLPKLWSLSLYGNKLEGNIPAALGEMESLRYLRLGDNVLTGMIPSELAQLVHLRSLSLYDNKLTGSILPVLGDLSHLSSLNLRDNDLTGSLPADLSRLEGLKYLKLRGNQLSGSIPQALFSEGVFPQLRQFDVRDNHLDIASEVVEFWGDIFYGAESQSSVVD
jgi:hypothetical protein